MSCHNIGRGMNEVVAVVLRLLDGGKISRDAAFEIILKCEDGVGWCDGNTYEAVECMAKCRCGKCLKPVADESELFSPYDVRGQLPGAERFLNKVKDTFVTDEVCAACFDEMLAGYYTNPEIGRKVRTGGVSQQDITELERITHESMRQDVRRVCMDAIIG